MDSNSSSISIDSSASTWNFSAQTGAHLDTRIRAFAETHVQLSKLEVDQSGTVQGMLISEGLQALLQESLGLGRSITACGSGLYKVDGTEMMLDDAIAENIIVQRINH